MEKRTLSRTGINDAVPSLFCIATRIRVLRYHLLMPLICFQGMQNASIRLEIAPFSSLWSRAFRFELGSPRIHAVLAEQGIHIGRKRAVRLMQQVRLSAHCRTHRVVTTKVNPLARVAENVLAREFEAVICQTF